MPFLPLTASVPSSAMSSQDNLSLSEDALTVPAWKKGGRADALQMTKLRSEDEEDYDGGAGLGGEGSARKDGGGGALGLKRKSSLVGMWKKGGNDSASSDSEEEQGNDEEKDASGEE